MPNSLLTSLREVSEEGEGAVLTCMAGKKTTILFISLINCTNQL